MLRRLGFLLAVSMLALLALQLFTASGEPRWRNAAMFAVGYLTAVSYVRGLVSARPMRAELDARLDMLELESDAHGAEQAKLVRHRVRSIREHYLRDPVLLFWTGGMETAAWQVVDELEMFLVTRDPARFRARLPALRISVASLGDPAADDAAKNAKDGADEYQALLAIERRILHRRDIQTDYHNNKLTWLSLIGVTAVAFVYALRIDGTDPLKSLVAGAVGAVLGRLTRVVQAPVDGHEYHLRWMSLFLAPVLGALLGWGGVQLAGLVTALAPTIEPGSDLGLALLCGFSARFFANFTDGIEGMAQSKVPGAKAA